MSQSSTLSKAIPDSTARPKSVTGLGEQDGSVEGNVSLSATELPARSPGWLKSAELAEANAAVAPMLRSYGECDAVELRSRTKHWLRRELGFMTNSTFSDRSAGKKSFGDELALTPRKSELGIAASERVVSICRST